MNGNTGNETREMSGTGYIVVRISTARGAVPVYGATVSIRGADKENSDIIITLTSGSSGITERIRLPAPPRELSEKPGNAKPYSNYNIDVYADGYYPQNYINVPVFDGITSYQTALLVPLSDNKYTDNYTYDGTEIYESENQDL